MLKSDERKENNMRRPLQSGDVLTLDRTEYTVVRILGEGSNAVTYYAEYVTSTGHKAYRMIKELYPRWIPNERLSDGTPVFRAPRKIWAREEASFDRSVANNNRLLAENQGKSLGLIKIDKACDLITRREETQDGYRVTGTKYVIYYPESFDTLNRFLSESGGKLAPADALLLARGILTALESFHNNGFLHLDLSADNIILLESERFVVGLIDYNSSYTVETLKSGEQIKLSVNDGYSPPEVYLNDLDAVSFSADLFSVAAILYYALTGSAPDTLKIGKNKAAYIEEMKTAVKSCCADLPAPVTRRIVELLLRQFSIDEKKRIQSCGDFIGEIDGILQLIENRGVSPETLWQSARASARHVPLQPGDLFRPEAAERICGALTEKAVENGVNVALLGPLAIGKTTFLFRFADRYLQRFDPDAPAVFYISLLNAVADGGDFILNRLICGLRPKDALGADGILAELKRGLLAGKLRVVVILDGFETDAGITPSIVSEVNALHEAFGKNMSFIICSRAGGISGCGFAQMEEIKVEPMTEKEIGAYLGRFHIAAPEPGSTLAGLLSNAFMLNVFMRVMQIKKPAPDQNADADGDHDAAGASADLVNEKTLIESYIEAVSGLEKIARGDGLCDFMLFSMAPAISYAEVTLLRPVKAAELQALTEKVFSTLRDPNLFYALFPDTNARISSLLSAVRNEPSVLYEKTVETLLVQWGFLRYEDGAFYFQNDTVLRYFFNIADQSAEGLDALLWDKKPKKEQSLFLGGFGKTVKEMFSGKKNDPETEEACKLALSAAEGFEAAPLDALRKARTAFRKLKSPAESDIPVYTYRSMLVCRELNAKSADADLQADGDAPVSYRTVSPDGKVCMEQLTQARGDVLYTTFSFYTVEGKRLISHTERLDDRAFSVDPAFTCAAAVEDGALLIYDVRNEENGPVVRDDQRAYEKVSVDPGGEAILFTFREKKEKSPLFFAVIKKTENGWAFGAVKQFDKKLLQKDVRVTSCAINGRLLYFTRSGPSPGFIFCALSDDKLRCGKEYRYKTDDAYVIRGPVHADSVCGNTVLFFDPGRAVYGVFDYSKWKKVNAPDFGIIEYDGNSGRFVYVTYEKDRKGALTGKLGLAAVRGGKFCVTREKAFSVAGYFSLDCAFDGSCYIVNSFGDSRAGTLLRAGTLDVLLSIDTPVWYSAGRVFNTDPRIRLPAPIPQAAFPTLRDMKDQGSHYTNAF